MANSSSLLHIVTCCYHEFPKNGTKTNRPDLLHCFDRALFHRFGDHSKASNGQMAPMVDGDSKGEMVEFGHLNPKSAQKHTFLNNISQLWHVQAGFFVPNTIFHVWVSIGLWVKGELAWQPSSNVVRSSSNPEPKLGSPVELRDLWVMGLIASNQLHETTSFCHNYTCRNLLQQTLWNQVWELGCRMLLFPPVKAG